MRASFVLSTILCATLAMAAGPVKWTFSAAAPAADGAVQVALTAVCEEGWHIYALSLPRDDGPLPTIIRTGASPDFKLPATIVEPPAEEVDDPNFGMRVRYHSGIAIFTVPIERLTAAAFVVTGEVEFMCCNDRTCLPPEVVAFSIPVPAAER